MTQVEWLEKARSNQDVLRSLVAEYHPSAGAARHEMEITAPNAELACERARASIAKREPQDPVQRLNVALAIGNIGEIIHVLDCAWFGVPESTSCWQINGFKEAVALLEDAPEQEE